jgi:nucleoside-diphosphate-sugar epimerase
VKLLVTGATGFVGRAVVARCAADPAFEVRAAVRGASQGPQTGVEFVTVGDLSGDTDWTRAVAGTDVVVHSAARVHMMEDRAADPLTEFRRVNVAGTLRLARQAATAGVKRFVFISSIKVNGERTLPGRPYRADDPPAPVDPYGVSKREAEGVLRALAAATGLEVVIIRPVLVYGPGVKANFRSMMHWLRMGIPLPLGAVHNKRSLVALDNLVDLIATCATHPRAANRTFLVSDGEDLSTTALMRRTAAALGKSARLLPVPASLLKAAFAVLGKPGVAQRLCDSLQVDVSDTRAQLGWSPPVGVDDALSRAASHFLRWPV